MKIVILGLGSMGKEVVRSALLDGHEIIAQIDPIATNASNRELTDDIAQKADIAIEFTIASAVLDNAKKYAAKEACSKALGSGLLRGISWKDIEVINNSEGKPYIILYKRALERLKKISKKKCCIEVTLSDEKNYSIANVIIFEKLHIRISDINVYGQFR